MFKIFIALMALAFISSVVTRFTGESGLKNKKAYVQYDIIINYVFFTFIIFVLVYLLQMARKLLNQFRKYGHVRGYSKEIVLLSCILIILTN